MSCSTTNAERIATKQTLLDEYYAAELAIIKGGQAYSIGNRSLTRADLQFIYDRIKRLEQEINQLCRGNNPIPQQRVVPRDF